MSMNKAKIKIAGLYDITRFVEAASKVEGSGVIVTNGKTTVDGSSLVAMLSLDTSNGLEVEFPYSAIDFNKFIQEFVIYA